MGTIYFICALFTCINAGSTLSIADIISHIFTLAVIIFLFGINGRYQASESDLNVFLTLIILVDLYLVLYCLMFRTSYYTQILHLTSAYGYELSAFLTSNHEFAMYMFFGVMACIWKLNKVKHKKALTVSIAILAVVFVIHIILSFSRTAMLACAAAFFVFVYIYNKRLFIILSILTAIAYALILSNREFSYFVFTVLLKQNTTAGRSNLYEIALRIFNESDLLKQLFGNGVSKTVLLVVQNEGHRSFHNAYLTTLISGGLSMLALLIYGALMPVYDSLKAYRESRFEGAWIRGLAFAGIAFMLTNTAIYFNSPIDSFLLTVFCVIIPRYRTNCLAFKCISEESRKVTM